MSVVGRLEFAESRAPKFTFSSSYPVGNSVSKRIIDIVGAGVLLVLASPLMLAAGCFATLDSGPILYRDKRYGRNGIVFDCLKIRTMRLNPEQLLADHLARDAAAKAEWDRDFKLRCDPRISRFGTWLRKSGLDELPQLWNVLRGDMSLVGPRPIPVAHGEARLYGRYLEIYCQTRPGITGLWQVSGRNDVPYGRRIAMAVHYVRRWSFSLDLAILARTVGAVLTGRGGY